MSMREVVEVLAVGGNMILVENGVDVRTSAMPNRAFQHALCSEQASDEVHRLVACKMYRST